MQRRFLHWLLPPMMKEQMMVWALLPLIFAVPALIVVTLWPEQDTQVFWKAMSVTCGTIVFVALWGVYHYFAIYLSVLGHEGRGTE
ncbi:hypothetical protein [Roseovarius sp. 2305UL8-3]|uniref:hypothetical protein n=1 Tax=Roseovarius conchicola TaxID=3121636 RepID=UPI003529A90A